MDAEIFYPVGIGKHIVCIDAALPAAAIQTRLQSNRCCRGEPRTPKETHGERKYSGCIPLVRVVSGDSPSAEREGKTKTDNKTKMIAMRFRESDYAAIKRKAEKANMNFTEFVTAAAMNKPITVINGLEDVLKEQKAIGRNLNQLTILCNMSKIVCPDLWELKEQYADMLTALNEIIGRCG